MTVGSWLALAGLVLLLLGLVDGSSSYGWGQVTSLPGIGPLKTRTLAGFLPANERYGAYLYFVFVESQRRPSADPVVIWLQGGPGSSSMFGLFVENGPYIISANVDHLSKNAACSRHQGTWSENPYSWNQNANVMWIDNPVGTGFSFAQNSSGYVRNETSLSQDLYRAVESFFVVEKTFASLPLYVFGESYAGKYVPWLAKTIIDNPEGLLKIAGIGLGDGWVDGYHQLPSNPEFLYMNNRITLQEWRDVNASFPLLWDLEAKGLWQEAFKLDTAIFATLCRFGNVTDAFDIRYRVDPTDAPWRQLLRVLATPAFAEALRTSNVTFNLGERAYVDLNGDEERSVLDLMPELFDSLSGVLIYNGQFDLICNYLGSSSWTRAVQWKGSEALAHAKNETWTVGGQPAGWLFRAEQLRLLVVANAGHMSPFDQPRATQAMLDAFLQGVL